MSEVISEKVRYDLLLELGDDSVYRVLLAGEVKFESKVLAAARIDFDERAAELSAAARAARGREAADFAIRGVIARANQAKAASRNAGRYRGKGG